MAKHRTIDSITRAIHERDIAIPVNNWLAWQDVFEHPNPRTNPLLTKPETFSKFTSEYSVGRTIRKGKADEFRKALLFDGALLFLGDSTGARLDRAESELRKHFGTLGGQRGVRSALSKIAAFLEPETFVAFDSFALVGLRRVRRQLINAAKAHGVTPEPWMLRPIASYSDYLTAINALLHSDLGDKIRAKSIGHYPTNASSKGDRFHRRVLDIYLSRIGARKFK
jgi:hypothetical protein